MPNYGVRFYRTELYEGMKRKPICFETRDEKDKAVWRYADHLSQVLVKYRNRQERGFPRTDPTELSPEELRKRTAVIFNEVEAVGSAGVRAEFRVGRSDDYDRAYPSPGIGPVVEPNATEVTTESTDEETEAGEGTPSGETADAAFFDLSGYSPTRPYRAALLLPAEGEIGILAVEAIGRACPYEFFTKWVSRWSREYQSALDEETPLPNDKRRSWWRLKAYPLGSREQLNTFLAGGTPEELVLLKHYFDQERNERFERFRLTARVGVTEKRWARKRLSDVFEVESDAAFAKQIAENFGSSVEQLDIDDGYLVVKTATGITKNISPSRLPEVFTYPVSDTRPTLEEFLSAVKTNGLALARAIDAKVDFDSW